MIRRDVRPVAATLFSNHDNGPLTMNRTQE